jgi:hypothetical protein
MWLASSFIFPLTGPLHKTAVLTAEKTAKIIFTIGSFLELSNI